MATETDGDDDALFGLAAGGFAWATGIEDTFIGQTERIGERVLDEYALTHHYTYWREDIDRAAALGVKALRYGIPWYKVESVPGVFDWSWTDRVLEYIAGKGIAVILDLMHYGTPLWLDNQFLNTAYPERVAAYAAAAANRYGRLLKHYTPLNEPWVTAAFTGLHGIWPPYLRGDDGLVKIMRQVARGMTLTIEAIRSAHPAALMISADAAGETIADTPELQALATHASARTFLASDLVTGKVGADHPLFAWLLRHGMSEIDLAWHSSRPANIDIMGVNYYPESGVVGLRDVNGVATAYRRRAGAAGMERALRSFAQRYNRPVMITETSTNGTLELRGQWLAESLAAITQIRAAGIPMIGYTWFPMFDLIDWSYRQGARPLEEFFARLGPSVLDPDQLKAMINLMRWTTLEQLPLEAFIAPMGLYELKMQFDGTFARLSSPLVAEYSQAITAGPQTLGEVATQITLVGAHSA